MTTRTQEDANLLAGAAQVDITPPAGTHLAGAIGQFRPAQLLGEPLFARALVLQSGSKRICLLSLDVTIITGEYTARIRKALHSRFGLDPDAVMVHVTQTHSAPPIGYFMVDPDFPPVPPEFEWVRGGEKAYSDWAAERAVEAVEQALAVMQPVQVAAGSGIEGRLAFNRRAVMRDGTVTMPGRAWPGGVGPNQIRYLEGPIDPELGVICLRNRALQIVSVIAHYTCHPVHGFPKLTVSPDWPGALAEELQRAHGTDCVPLVINGACGNINPWPPFDPDYVEDHRRMGRVLAEGVQRVLETLTFSDEATLDHRLTHLGLPLREVTEEELTWAQSVLGHSPQPTWRDEQHTGVDTDWICAASVYSVHLMRQRSPVLQYEVQVLRIGQAAIVGLPGEPFVEGQLAIKLASPTYPTYVAHATTDYVGYLPTREALQRGGHEVNTRYWTKLTAQALDMVVAGATDLLQSMFGAETQ